MRKHTYGYTMVEILMVIVIAAILFGIGIPAFSTMIRGNAMTVSIRQLTAKIQAARSYAVTNRCKVAIVFPLPTELPANKRNLGYSVYRVCIVNEESSEWKFESWIDGEEWNRFPTGVLVQSFSTTQTVKSCNIADLGGTTCDFTRTVIFKPNGQMTTSTTLHIYLAYGRYISGSDPIYTEVENEKVIRHPININPFTGKVVIESAEPVPATP